MSNLSRWIRFHAKRQPDRSAVIYNGAHVSYGMLWERIGRIAADLRARGVRPGDRVALLMKNSTAFLEIAFAVSHVGAVLVPINYRLARDEVHYILQDSGAVCFYCDEVFAFAPAIIDATIIVDAAAQADGSRLSRHSPDEEPTPVAAGDLLRIMYTSGTTDRPKGVTHSYANFYAKTTDHIVVLGLNAETRLLVVGPLYHVGAYDLPGVAALLAGGLMCIQRDFDAVDALDLIERERLDASWLAPVMTGMLLAEQKSAPRDVSSLRWTIGGGERTPASRIIQYGQVFPTARFIDGYGLTETCSGDTLMEGGRELEKIGSVGRPLPQVDIEIRDGDGGALPRGTEGEICIRGPKVTAGYWNAPEKSAACFFGDWLRTGDIGYLDDDGFLFLTDRKKDMIISGGENIASSEIERILLELPQVKDAAAIAVPDEQWGERPIAFVALFESANLSEPEALTHCRQRLARFKVPDRIFFETELPRNASGKVLKREIRAKVAKGKL